MQILEIIKWLKNKDFKEAVTYRHIAPHEYIVRDNLSAEDKKIYDRIILFIENYGERKMYFGNWYTYIYLEEYKYWSIDNILNRAISKNE